MQRWEKRKTSDAKRFRTLQHLSPDFFEGELILTEDEICVSDIRLFFAFASDVTLLDILRSAVAASLGAETGLEEKQREESAAFHSRFFKNAVFVGIFSQPPPK
jgi:hypothetical protein